jgi:hypothetical protein
LAFNERSSGIFTPELLLLNAKYPEVDSTTLMECHRGFLLLTQEEYLGKPYYKFKINYNCIAPKAP